MAAARMDTLIILRFDADLTNRFYGYIPWQPTGRFMQPEVHDPCGRSFFRKVSQTGLQNVVDDDSDEVGGDDTKITTPRHFL